MRIDQSNLDDLGEFKPYAKNAITMMAGPFDPPVEVVTQEGDALRSEEPCFIALDAEGWPYPIKKSVHDASYVGASVPDADPHWRTEPYVPLCDPELLQRVFETGLVFMSNAAVFHHYGFAIGVSVEEDRQTVTGFNLHRTDDPGGVWFDEDLVIQGRRRMRESGLLLVEAP